MRNRVTIPLHLAVFAWLLAVPVSLAQTLDEGLLDPAWFGGAGEWRQGGDVRLEGRFVDVNAGSNAAKWLVGFGAGSATATWDMRLVDVETGEIVAGIHHRSVSGTNYVGYRRQGRQVDGRGPRARLAHRPRIGLRVGQAGTEVGLRWHAVTRRSDE